MTNARQNIDDILAGIKTEPSEQNEDIQQKEIKEVPETEREVQQKEENRESEQEVDKVSAEEEVEHKNIENKQTKSSDVDDYGNEVSKVRTYTEEEVQRMIRDRLSRGQHAQHPQQQVQQAAENFKADPNSNEDWETQLASFVRDEIYKIGKEAQTIAFQEREISKQAEFESKFSTGMEKYKDFRETVGQMPITDSIMMATRDMKDPAAFLYAATKMQPEELKRIASLQDPFTQAVEIGRLEATMRKAANISKTSKPLSVTKGDVSDKVVPKRSIDDKIHSHAKRRLR